ncbi:MAG: beta-propeller fold lactonase family protein, partial [Bacteroidota bacterium]
MKETTFYVGTYTSGESKGIYEYSIKQNGELKQQGLLANTSNPSFLAKSLDGKFLLAVNENNEGTVTSFKINNTGLDKINQSSSGGAHPCHLIINEKGKVLVANYTGGNIGMLEINSSGELSSLLDVQQHEGSGSHERQEKPHAHSVWQKSKNEEVIAVDLGTNELIFSMIDETDNKLKRQQSLKMKEGAGPRHLAFHPKQDWIYVINELDATVSLLKKMSNTYDIVASF